MKLLISTIIILTAAAFSYAQTDLPDRGSIEEIKGKSQYYLVSDAESRKLLIKPLQKQKGLTETGQAKQADFVLEYKTLNVQYVSDLRIPSETGQLDVYYLREGRKVIVWSDSAYSGFRKTPQQSLVEKFLKALSKISK